MTGDIFNAIAQECKAFLESSGGTLLFKTNYRPKHIPTYIMPLLVIDMSSNIDAFEYIGGVTRADWNIDLSSYNFMPDGYIDDDTGYSRDLLDVIDDIRRHFSTAAWINTTNSPTMIDVLDNYCLKLVLGGISPANQLEGDGLIMGFKITFDCCAIDNVTGTTQQSTSVLTTVVDGGLVP
jgi:hypothetical protein